MELLAVIVLISIVGGVAVTSVISASEKLKSNMFCEKVQFIEEGALLWGQDNYDYIFKATNKSLDITVQELINQGYLKADKENSAGEYIENPQNEANMAGEKVNLTITNKRVYAYYRYTDEEKKTCKIDADQPGKIE